MNWIKEHFIEAIGLIIALLTFFGIQPTDTAIELDFLPALLYVIASALIGWGFCRAFYGTRLRFTNINNGHHMTIDEFSEQFDSTPYELKVFLKTVLDKGAAYRRTDDYLGWESYLDYLSNFVTAQTIRNGISKYEMKEDARRLFTENPRLLSVVADDDVESKAIGGSEGIQPSYFSDRFYWWYYSDDPNAPKPFSIAGISLEPTKTNVR